MHDATRHDATRCDATPRNAVRRETTRHNTARRDAARGNFKMLRGEGVPKDEEGALALLEAAGAANLDDKVCVVTHSQSGLLNFI